MSSEATEVPAGTSLADRVTKPDESKTAESVPIPNTESSVDGASEGMLGSQLQEPDYQVNVKLSDLQADPSNPLFSVKSFDQLGLDERILKGLLAMNFRKPSKVQERALPLLMSNPPKNLIGQSQSGTGKTAAFTLNVLSRLDLSTEQARRTPQALILAPTRELARQITGVISLMGQFVDGLVVGTSVPTEIATRPKLLEVSVVVGTPGTVLEQIRRKVLNPTNIKVLVLDEADNMMDQQGLGDQCLRVRKFLPSTVQVVLFSATFPDHVLSYAHTFAPNANEITLQHEELTVEGIKQLYIDCNSEQQKFDCLVNLYGTLTVGSSIIFVATRASAEMIEKRMTSEGHAVACLTGNIEGARRDTVIDAFRVGAAKVLITTNVLARGIDVSTVSLVINYDVPELYIEQNGQSRRTRQPDLQTYLHRIGRTGRFGRVGVAITLVSNREEWQLMKGIQDHFGVEIASLEISDWDETAHFLKKVIKSSRAASDFAGGQI
ncbi:hypothetical protein N7495_007825 [Penicillium taxi]|uniref:uncharacterized protein n=1 Tax=Penicillium taxi TaxID=168475 RepID=UPI0025453025|nr:uncharacterized protein N7495_007825 [Penicillium taxi]KAJ5887784.1 hypothetical protein N7495_007825 [Penicillium taxi]